MNSITGGTKNWVKITMKLITKSQNIISEYFFFKIFSYYLLNKIYS